MFAIVVEGYRRACFESTAAVGRSTSNDLVLPNPDVSRQHALIVIEDGRLVFKDLRSTHGTFVNGKRIHWHTVEPNDRIRVGPFTLTIEASAGPDPVESNLLAAITERQDATSRLVYADWLEERGELVRAEFLRVQEALVAAGFDEDRAERLRALAASIELKWRHAVARPAVEGCAQRFNFQCPREWGSLAPTERPDVRHCDGCHKQVYYCSNVAAARKHAELGDCVAVDIIPLRRPRDLEPEEISIRMGGLIAPPDY